MYKENLLTKQLEDYRIEQVDTDVQEREEILRTFTLRELAKYNGKNGMPGYIAVYGVVYDITNTAAWAAATHFGLSAGNDVTNSFSYCHIGQSVLNRLRAVGRLV